MKLIILGLRRSGTTIFWSIFRQDKRFIGYNEPFNPAIRDICVPNWHNLIAYREFHELWQKNPWEFWTKYRAIPRLEEMQEGLSDKQREYLAYLLASGEHIVFDFTRCHFKIAALYDMAPDAVLLHLYRPPWSHATSVLLPSNDIFNRETDLLKRSFRKVRRSLHKMVVKRKFWSLDTHYPNWGFEELIGHSPNSLFGYRLRDIGLDPEEVYMMPAVGRLLAYWRVNYERVEQDGPKYYGARFVSVNFNEFCRNPRSIVSRVYNLLERPMPDLDFRSIHSPHGPYQPNQPAWEYYYKRLGLPAIT